MTTNAVYETIDLINDLSAACTNYWEKEDEQKHLDWVGKLLIGHIEQHHTEIVNYFKREGRE